MTEPYEHHNLPTPRPSAPDVPQQYQQPPQYHSPTTPAPPPYGQYPYAQPPAVHVNVYRPPVPTKSAGLAVLLAFLFGPLGMLYSTVTGALVIFCLNLIVIVIGVLTVGIGLLLGFCTWIAGMVWAYTAAEDFNRRLRY